MSKFSDKYSKYGSAYSKKVEVLKSRAATMNAKGKKKGNTSQIMGKPILNIKEFSQEYEARFIPSLLPEKNWFFAEIHYHYIQHPTIKKSDGNPTTVVATCPELYGKECFLCTEWKRILDMVPGGDWKERSENKYKERSKKENQLYLPRKRFFSPVIHEDEIKVLSYGATVKKQLEECYMDVRFGGAFNHPVEGFPVYIEKTKTGNNIFDVEYKVRYSNNNSGPIADTEEGIDFILEQAPDVWTFVSEEHQWLQDGTLYTNAQIREILKGADKDIFRAANDEAYKKNGFVDLDTGIAQVEKAFAYEEELSEDNEEDKFDAMSKTQLATECKKRGIRASIKWTEEQYREPLRNHDLEDIMF